MNFLNKHLNTAGELEDMSSKGSSADDLMFDFPFGKKSIKHFRQIVPVQIHHFYVVDEIRDVDAYLNMINTLKTSEQHDTIFIYINTPGGNLITTLQIVAAIKQSAATVVTCMEGQVASAGTMIFLAGHRHMVGPNTFFMAHNYSAITGGKGFEIKTRQKFDEQYFSKLVKDIYTGFLTEEEINAIMEDRDVWLDAEEVAKRLQHKMINPHASQEDAQNFLAALLGDSAVAQLPSEEPAKPEKPAKQAKGKKPAKQVKTPKVDKATAK